MNEMTRMQKMLWIVAFGIMALCFLVSAFMPQHRDIAHGIILGTGVSCLNVLHMAYKIRQVASAAAGERKKRVFGIGFGVRLGTSILAVVLAIEFPAYFHEIAVMASLVTGQFLLLIIGIIFALQEK
ncbi:ATP synthase subunit I [Paenibacillus polymyxa]|uniref:ATP synthase subunit I n=1 Tax=Paenibacillus polymyxa TaxID=1406 RepID=UPI00237986CA|nr:ATP synthase subunit I [Paenibacillus polymyxa]WDM21686.1 ATP synthase subunit I [Paenibacillus polymyxa]